ncbi:MAG TPA: hemolysin family protein [Ignavibacteriaceae bacterium]|nr:hemolysin family protein [Ignavibacteriaceae bacterium]
MELLLLYLLIAVFISFLCSFLEAILLTITPFFIEAKVIEGKKYGIHLRDLKKDIDKPLAAILTLNTFAHTMGAAGVGAQVQIIWGNEYLTIASIIVTIVILIFSEILPKTLGATYWRYFAGFATITLRVLIIVLYPFIVISQLFTKILKGKEQKAIERTDIEAISELGYKEGIISKDESEIFKNLFRFSLRKAYSVMINRQDIVWVDINDPPDVTKQIIIKSKYSRLPLCDGSIDQIIGIISVKKFSMTSEEGKELNLRDLAIQPIFVPENITAIRILERFRETKIYIAIVVDEYGSTEGMITLHDLIENVLGDLPERHEANELPIFEREDGSLLINGDILIDELKEKLKIIFEHQDEYITLGGYIMFKLNKIPQTGDKFKVQNYVFEVVDMDGKRVDKVLVIKD